MYRSVKIRLTHYPPFDYTVFGLPNFVCRLRLAQLISVTVGPLGYAIGINDRRDYEGLDEDQGCSKRE
jgi:hypothetical protein